MSRHEIDSLLSLIDCYVSLHRSEGFGLGPAEAMAHGKVAMLTNWSGNTQYMTQTNCIPIPYTLEQIGQDYGPYSAHQYWASPDISEASAQMKNIAKNPELAERIGTQAQKTIADNFSEAKIGQLMKVRLKTIERIISMKQKRNLG